MTKKDFLIFTSVMVLQFLDMLTTLAMKTTGRLVELNSMAIWSWDMFGIYWAGLGKLGLSALMLLYLFIAPRKVKDWKVSMVCKSFIYLHLFLSVMIVTVNAVNFYIVKTQ